VENSIERLIDANCNRLKEGIRVLEDISRYILDDAKISIEFKHLRHSLQRCYNLERLKYRDIKRDVLKESIDSEMKRDTIISVAIANFSRTQESARVLEEIFKLNLPSLSHLMKECRYKLYNLEKELIEKLHTK